MEDRQAEVEKEEVLYPEDVVDHQDEVEVILALQEEMVEVVCFEGEEDAGDRQVEEEGHQEDRLEVSDHQDQEAHQEDPQELECHPEEEWEGHQDQHRLHNNNKVLRLLEDHQKDIHHQQLVDRHQKEDHHQQVAHPKDRDQLDQLKGLDMMLLVMLTVILHNKVRMEVQVTQILHNKMPMLLREVLVMVEVLHMELVVSMDLRMVDIHRVQVEVHTNQGQGLIRHILHKEVMKLQHLIIHIMLIRELMIGIRINMQVKIIRPIVNQQRLIHSIMEEQQVTPQHKEVTMTDLIAVAEAHMMQMPDMEPHQHTPQNKSMVSTRDIKSKFLKKKADS